MAGKTQPGSAKAAAGPAHGEGQYLAELAKQLRLTPKQRAFAEFLVADPQRNQTRAAVAAGAGRGAAVTASKWLTLAKVQAYLGALDERAEALAARRTGEAVGILQQSLEGLTAIARADIGALLKQDKDGRWEVDLEALAAAPPGAFTYRQKRNGWSLRSHAGDALRALLKYHLRRLRR